MLRHRTAFPAIGLAALLLALLAPVAHAGGITRWVDDDGRAGPSGCDGGRSAPRKVQAAIDASGSGDTIVVCPGLYQGEFVIATHTHDGLTVRGARPGTARLRPRAAPTKVGLGTVYQADGVTFKDLVLQVPTAAPCRRISVVLWAEEAQGLLVSGVRIEPAGKNTIGPCGYDTGILATTSSTVTVVRSTVRDFRVNGIFASGEVGGPYPELTVKRSRILYLHAAEGRHAQLGEAATGLYGLRTNVTRFRNSVVRSATTGGRTTPLLGTGINAYSVANPTILGNTVRTVTWAISVTATLGDVSHNTLRVGRKVPDSAPVGIWVGGGSGVTVTNNTVHGFGYGLYLDGGAQNHVVSDNDATGNRILSCSDDTTGGFGTLGTSNFWTANLGDASFPVGLCAHP